MLLLHWCPMASCFTPHHRDRAEASHLHNISKCCGLNWVLNYVSNSASSAHATSPERLWSEMHGNYWRSSLPEFPFVLAPSPLTAQEPSIFSEWIWGEWLYHLVTWIAVTQCRRDNFRKDYKIEKNNYNCERKCTKKFLKPEKLTVPTLLNSINM